MKLFKRIKLYKTLSLILSTLTVLSAIAPVLFFPSTFSLKTSAVSAQAEGYLNPYVNPWTDVTLTEKLSTESSSVAPQYQINNVQELLKLAKFSQRNTCAGMSFSITASTALNIPQYIDADFHGIGNEDYPFEGTLIGVYQDTEQNEIITGKYSLFNCISNKATLQKLKINTNSSSSGLADKLVINSNTSGTYSTVTVDGSVVNSFTGANAAMLFGEVIKKTGFDSATLNISNFSVRSTGVTAYDGNSAFLIGKINSGITLNLNLGFASEDSSLTVGESSPIISYGADAGAVVGNIGTDSTLNLACNVSVTGSGSEDKITATADNNTENITAFRRLDENASPAFDKGGNAGAIAGKLESGAHIAVSGNLTVTNAVIGGGNSVGGLVGSITDGDITATGTINSSTFIRGGVYCGGVAGLISFNTKEGYTASSFTINSGDSYLSVIIPTDWLRFGKVGAGGLYGKLKISASDSVSFGFTTDFTNAETEVNTVFKNIPGDGADVDTVAGKDNICLGGIVGIYTSDKIENGFTVNGGDTEKTVSKSTYDTDSGVYCYGGLIGDILKDSYCLIKNAGVSFNGVGNIGDDYIYAMNMGGICAVLSSGAILDINGTSVDGRFCAKYDLAYSGGIAARTGEGSVLRLDGNVSYGENTYAITSKGIEIDLTDNSDYADYTGNIGQIVGNQESSLIFAEPTWSFTRCNVDRNIAYIMDDIGNYGEVFRNSADSSPIQLSTDHKVLIAPITGSSDSNITLNSADDCIKLAVTLSSHGYFTGVFGVDCDNYANILKATITVGNTINLEETGVVSLTRNDTTSDAFTGTLSGTVGENGKPTITLASGKKYFENGSHGNGEIYGQPYIGLFAALGGGAKITNINISGEITCGQSNSSYVLKNDVCINAGGIAGHASGNIEISGVTTSVNINEKNSRNNSSNNQNTGYYGGLIGFYEGNELKVSNCTGNSSIIVNSKKSINSSISNNSISGGFVGKISCSETGNIFSKSTLTGSITASGEIADLKAGGIVGEIISSATTPEGIVLFDGVSIPQTAGQTVSAVSASNSCGSLIAHTAKNITVKFTNTQTVDGALQNNVLYGTVTSNGNANFGGLFYEITGKLALDHTEVRGSFTGNCSSTNISDGVVVCRGTDLYMTVDAATVTVEPSDVTDNNNYCDDLVGNNKLKITGHTTQTGHSGGIVTIQTMTDGQPDPIGSTAHPWNYTDESRKNNPNARYYYNVEGLDSSHGNDCYVTNVITNKQFTCKEDILFWHILNYTVSSTKCAYFFYTSVFKNDRSYTASDNAEFNMGDGFCLYPTTVPGGTYNFNDKTIVFDNVAVNRTLPENAKTTDQHCQHYMMQTGLFYDVTQSLTVNNLTVSGNTGMYNGGSGALICGSVYGSKSGTNYNVKMLTVSKIKLENLYINGCNVSNNYAPLLINKIPTCVTSNFSGIIQEYSDTNIKAGSSLIGDVGNSEATRLTVSFSNMVLDGKISNSVFYRSSFINNFQYLTDGTSTGTYNFTHIEDWENPLHQVTYGKELTADNTKYFDNQSVFVDPENSNHTEDPAYDFSSYLPYIFGSNNKIKVNISGNLTEGCGTYADPYIIRTKEQLLKVKLILSSGKPDSKWTVNYPNSLDEVCDKENGHKSYTATNEAFNNSAINRSWFQHAYYKLEDDISFSATDDFAGLGVRNDDKNIDSFFAGVIIGKKDENSNYTVTISLPPSLPSDSQNLTQIGFVNSAGGCVLKDINIRYVYENESSDFTVNSNDKSVFGGAIGTVQAGDNIIDNVSIMYDSKIYVQSRLAAVGGYIGLNMAGGVIFRNMHDSDGNISDGHSGGIFYDKASSESQIQGADTTWFYVNPYIGRTLDGYAVYESSTPSLVLENTNKNYKIHTLNPNSSSEEYAVTTSLIEQKIDSSKQYLLATVNNAEGLYILASTINCGAQATGAVYAYGKQARVRNAYYTNVGNSSSQDEDLKTADKDWKEINSNINSNTAKPYLTSYIGGAYNCYLTLSYKRLLIEFERTESIMDMQPFGNGFRGIGGRYKTLANRDTSNANNQDRNNPLLRDIGEFSVVNGQGCTVNLAIDYKEYKNDYCYINNVGLFNTASNKADKDNTISTYKDITVKGYVKAHVYDSSTGSEILSNVSNIIVGGFISQFTKISGLSYLIKVNFDNVNINDLSVSSPGVAGGLIGDTVQCKTLTLNNCGIENVTVTGRNAAGGYIGQSNTEFKTSSEIIHCNDLQIITDDDFTLSNITVINDTTVSDPSYKEGRFGGLIGISYYQLNISPKEGKLITIDNVNISSVQNALPNSCFGGIAGKLYSTYNNTISGNNSPLSTISSVSVTNSHIQSYLTEQNTFDSKVEATGNAGGLFGVTASPVEIDGCSVNNTDILCSNNASGIIAQGESEITVNNTSVGNTGPVSIIAANHSSGIVAYIKKNVTANNISLGNARIAAFKINNSVTAAGFFGMTTVESSAANIAITADNLKIENCFIYSDQLTAGIIGADNEKTTTYLNNITLTGNSLSQKNGTSTVSGISNNIKGKIYGSNILNKNNRMGYSTVSQTNILNKENPLPVVTASNLCSYWINNINQNATVSLSAVSRQDMDVKYQEYGGKGAGEAVVVYADYDGIGSGSDSSAVLGADVPVYPAREIVSDTYFSDGMVDGTPSKIYSEAFAKNTLKCYNITGESIPAINAEPDVYLTSISGYFPDAVESVRSLPLLYVKGDTNGLITEYADLLTNGGFSAFKNKAITGTALTVTTKQYSVNLSKISAVADNASTSIEEDKGSVAYNNGTFSARQNYDTQFKNGENVTGMTFTVVTISFANPSNSENATETFNMSFAVFYPQVLTIDRNVQIVNHEEYDISKIVSKTKEEQLNSAENVNITVGGTFTAYLEYIYNNLCRYDNWNYSKYIRINEKLPNGTVISLVDLNSADEQGNPDSNGYCAYYLTVDDSNRLSYSSGNATPDYYYINLSSFKLKNHDGTISNFAETNLMDLPLYADERSISWHDYGENANMTGYGSERYLMIVKLPDLEDDNDIFRYTFYAGLDPTAGEEKNVEQIEINNYGRVVTVWKKPDITSAFRGDSSQMISRTDVISADYEYNVTFPQDYVGTFKESDEETGGNDNSEKYGVIRYSITDGTNEIALPAGTVITIGNNRVIADGSSTYFTSVISDENGDALKILKTLAAITPKPEKDVFTYSQHVELDFSSVDASTLNNSFLQSKNYKLKGAFYLTTDADNPMIGQSTVNSSLNLTAENNNNAVLKVNVDSKSLLHLGVNTLDENDDTNNGVIDYHVILDISRCNNIEEIKNSGIDLTYTLYKKGADNKYYAASEDCLKSVNIGNKVYDDTYNQYSWDCSMELNRPDSGDDFANYRFEITATVQGIKVNNTALNLNDYFIYTIANISPSFVD